MARRYGPKVKWKVVLPEELAASIELRYCDPVSGRPDYGARARLITALLQQFDEELRMQTNHNEPLARRLVRRLLNEELKERVSP